MSDEAAVIAIAGHAREFLRLLDDINQEREVRVFACGVVHSALGYAHADEGLVTEVLATIRRAIERDDETPLALLHALDWTIKLAQGVSPRILRLGSLALELDRTMALARITRALASWGATGALGDSPRAPPHWIRALVGSAAPGDVSHEVLAAVVAWLKDERSDGVAEVIAYPDAWIEQSAECF